MERRWYNKRTHEIGVAFVSDSDADILRCCGYAPCPEEDFTDFDYDGEPVEIWKPVKDFDKMYGRVE